MSKDRYRPSSADFEVVRTKEKVTDPRVFLPYGDGGSISPVARPGFERLPTIEEEILDDNWHPKNLRVVNQVVRYNEQGRMRVDVTLQWDNLSGAESYFVRVTPVEEG